MTSRPPLGVQRRPPQQRKLSGPSLSQRPPLPPSPIRKETTVIDLTSPEATDAASIPPLPAPPPQSQPPQHPARFLAQRRGGSRLKLELKLEDGADDNITQAGISESPKPIESSKPSTPSRIVHNVVQAPSNEPGEPSPNPSVPPQATDGDVAMPFPKRRKRQAPPDTELDNLPPPPPPLPPRQAKKDPSKKEAAAQIWKVEIPADAPRYYIRGNGNGKGSGNGNGDSQVKKRIQASAIPMGPPPISGLGTGSSMNMGMGMGVGMGVGMSIGTAMGMGTNFGSKSGLGPEKGNPPPTVGYADFFPWTGNHPEDKWSENIIRQGYFDRPGFNPNPETQSAKATLFPALKGKSGLNALSQLFTSMLGHRRHHTHITANRTFRPPPRVTIPDSKREIWLNDLANPATPLRKFSRTIPHGIRNQVLLEQCLNKKIPIDRAVWLTKCVGANEIRAGKRNKGGVMSAAHRLGGEIHWIKEWTGHIEKFMENVLFMAGDNDWRSKVDYSIVLVSKLYEQHLLDREHFMEWLVSGFEGSKHQKLPMWMFITEIYWKDILKVRRYGRRLVAALVTHHHLVLHNPDKDLLKTLPARLTRMLSTVILGSPENFICPSVWFKYRDTIKTCLPAADEARQKAFMAISSRNEQLVAYANRSQPATRHILVQLLDRAPSQTIQEGLAHNCWNISKDKSALARALLEWSTSIYRPGKTKIYVASEIFRNWARNGLDVTREVLAFLDTDPCEEKERKDDFYHLVAELVRYGMFQLPLYGQWLIARGGLTNPDDVETDGPAATRLLVEIPPMFLSEPHREIRSGILRRANFNVADQEQDKQVAMKFIWHFLGYELDPADPIRQRKQWSTKKLIKMISSSGRALKTEVSGVIREWLDSGSFPDWGPKGNQVARQRISFSTFTGVRTVLEAAEDLHMLADVVRIAIDKTTDPETLAAITNTVCRHVDVFAVLGEYKVMFVCLNKRLRMVYRAQGVAARPFLAALISLAPRIPCTEQLSVVLSRELAMCDRRNPVDVCSPVSDNMLTRRLQDDDSDLEEIEKALAAGTSMDRKTLENIFHTIIQRLQTIWDKGVPEVPRAYAVLLARLRRFDIPHFDSVMGKWLAYLRTSITRPPVQHIFPVLVSAGCLNWRAILSTTLDSSTMMPPPSTGSAWPQVVQITSRTWYLQDTLCLLMTPLPSDYKFITSEERYRFTNLQQHILRDRPKEVLNLVGLAMAEYLYCRVVNGVHKPQLLDEEDNQRRFFQLIKLLILKDAAGVGRALSMWASKNPEVFAESWIDGMTTKLLIPTADKQLHITFDQVLELTNEFTWPFCQVQLILGSTANAQSSQQAGERQPSHLDLLTKAMDRAIDKKNITWVGIVHSLNPEVIHHLRSRAHARFLGLIPSPRDPPPTGSSSEQPLQVAENLLSVIEALMRGSNSASSRPLQLGPEVAVKLTDLWELLCAPDFNGKQMVVNKWLPIVLNFITLHLQAFDASKPSTDLRAKLLVVCAGLIQELDYLHKPGLNTQALAKRIFDLSCILSDNLPEETRNLCIRAIKDSSVSADPRMRYVFGIMSGPQSENLMLSSRETVSPAAAAMASTIASASVAGRATSSTPVPTSAPGLPLKPSSVPGLPPKPNCVPGLPPKPTSAPKPTPTGAAKQSSTAGPNTATPSSNNNTNTVSNSNNNINNMPFGTPPIASMILGTPPALWGVEKPGVERLSPFTVKTWDIVNVMPQSVGENDTSLSLALFEARGQRAWPK
ncbi:putative mediator of RNA polymerase II transcription [Podospora fimiseda]|uniref:Mediator of RNA polymerase II transcription subunit 12 n=1 Tax=Podospora fimiseda TaxID=252190 RepID=A0AAN7BXK4_9PEZI|nr:putative mediator of RNA polymerase II transcription [Podospora fimiseda]